MNVVVDTNILAYYWLPGARTEEAVALRRSTGPLVRAEAPEVRVPQHPFRVDSGVSWGYG